MPVNLRAACGILFGLLTGFLFALAPGSLCAQGFAATTSRLTTTSNDQGVLIVEADRPILFYQRTTKSLDSQTPRANYVHPLYGLDGQTLTEDFPADHRHHRGIFWAWHQVWVGDKMIGDPWLCKDFQWDVVSTTVRDQGDRIELMAEVLWKSPLHLDDAGDAIAIVQEQATITVYPRESAYRCIDFDINLQALVEGVRIGGSDDEKGYGGFSPRIKLNSDQRFTATKGDLETTKNAMDVGPWVDVSDSRWGLAMISHSANPGTPQQWILRSKRSMQNAVYPGRHPESLSTETPTRLRYRLVVHDGTLTANKTNELHQSFDSRR
jgi:hypothetical protein